MPKRGLSLRRGQRQTDFPFLMAALTTILGMIPLLQDIFFVDMAVTIMFGLAFGTVLTLIVVPVFYEIFFKIKPTKS